MGAWTVVKDILLTGTGLALIVSQTQMVTQHPSYALIAAGLSLAGVTAAPHIRSIMSSGTGGPSSPSRRQSSSSE